MKVIMIFDQIQAGVGTKDDTMVALAGKKEAIGPAVMMAPFLKEVEGNVIACLYCGTGTYLENPEEVSRKLCAMVKKLNPDVVMCGPAFNYADYAAMSAKVACDINKMGMKAFAAMSVENEKTIAEYKDKILIVETPKKGGLGLNDSLKHMCILARALADEKNTDDLKQQFCFK